MDTVEELLGLLQRQTEINQDLVNAQQDALVDGNISKSPGGSTFGQKVSPKLSGSEVRRTQEVSNIFIKTFFEAEKKQKSDRKEKTQTSQLFKRAEKARERQPQANGQVPKSSLGWLDTLLGALGLGGLLKKLSPKFFKGLFSKILKGIGNLVKGLGKMLSGFWKKITSSKLFRTIGRAIKSAIKGIGRMLGRIGSAFKKFIGSIVKKLKSVWSSVRNSKAFKAVSKAFRSAGKAIGSFFTGLKNKLLSLLNTAKEFAAKLIPEGAKEFVGKAAGKAGSAAKGVGQAVAEKAGGFWNAVKGIGGKVVSGAKSVGSAVMEGGAKAGQFVVQGAEAVGSKAIQGAKAVGNFALGPAKEAVKDASKGIIKGSGGMFKLMGKLAKLPVIGPLIEGAFTAYDIKGLKEKYEKGEISLEEFQAQSGRRVVQGVSALGGSALGTFLGGAAGSIIPVAGNVVGGILGAIGGDMLGRFVGGLLNDYILPPKYSKSIGAFVTGTPPPKEEMQDFIIRGNEVYPFSSKDEVLGMKSGGAIDQLLNSKQDNGMGLLVKAADMANMYLQGIERNTRELLKAMGGKPGPAVTVVNGGNGGGGGSSERPTSTVGNNRLGYASSPYALA